MLIAIAIAEEIQGSKNCIGARTQQRTSLGLVSHMNFDYLRLPPGLRGSRREHKEARREPEKISNKNGFMWGTTPCIRIGVQEDNFVFDHFFHFHQYTKVQSG